MNDYTDYTIHEKEKRKSLYKKNIYMDSYTWQVNKEKP